MEFTIELGKAKIHVKLTKLDYKWEEFPGVINFSIPRNQVNRIIDVYRDEEEFNYIDQWDSDQPEFIPTYNDADTLIKFIRAMAKIGGEFNIEWEGCNRTWFFHDLDHARMDCDKDLEIRVDSDREKRAQIQGCREALKHGIPISEVCKCVVSILKEYEDRFKLELDIWDEIFEVKEN